MVLRFVLALIALFLIPRALWAQTGGLSERVAALEAQVETLTQRLTALTQPLIVDVDCGAGQRLQPALNFVQRHPSAVIINLFGVCSERVVIARSNLTIRAGAPGAGISAPPPVPGGGILSVNTNTPTPKAFTVQGLALSGGMAVEHFTEARLVDCVISNSSGLAVLARHGSTVRLDNTLIADSGVAAESGSMIIMNGGEIRNSVGNGMNLRSGSTAQIGGGALIVGSAGDGVNGTDGSSVSLGVATITQNGTDGGAYAGVFLSGGSSVSLSAGTIITANRGAGIALMDTSLAMKPRAEADIHITNNTGFGIGCSVAPAVAQIIGFTFQTGNVSGNEAGNIECPISPGPRTR